MITEDNISGEADCNQIYQVRREVADLLASMFYEDKTRLTFTHIRSLFFHVRFQFTSSMIRIIKCVQMYALLDHTGLLTYMVLE